MKGQETSRVPFLQFLQCKKIWPGKRIRSSTPKMTPWGHMCPDRKAQPPWGWVSPGWGVQTVHSGLSGLWSSQRCWIDKFGIHTLAWSWLLDSGGQDTGWRRELHIPAPGWMKQEQIFFLFCFVSLLNKEYFRNQWLASWNYGWAIKDCSLSISACTLPSLL